MLIKYLLVASAACLLGACASQNGEDLYAASPLPAPSCDPGPVTYALTVAPLLQQQCTRCHNSTQLASGLNLSLYAQVKAVATNGSLLGTVNHDPGFPAMPQGGAKLSDCDIGHLRQWVAAGAPNN
ncbi:hypothetical protein GO988_01400 [Hymenobacter sp. HMF4947]|uniref:Cytochrome c domain-containing protein n=1 Tax=Hymenobacter ginkgonis TaxID=2682976 RepID=A0A7K1T987_9BACT|nr:hypothetical protein [Hymenobacter ginkgonis]MVN74974.1 hypothetical protein [Hymenobacter ginkgonis]